MLMAPSVTHGNGLSVDLVVWSDFVVVHFFSFLGNRPVKLHTVTVRNTNAVLALSSRAWLTIHTRLPAVRVLLASVDCPLISSD
jgi:hypothetical protein